MDEHVEEVHRRREWMPFLLPLILFLAAFLFIVPLGIVFLQIALTTGKMFQEPVPHSMAVIIVALVVSLAITGIAAFVASRPEQPVPPRTGASHH